MRVARCTNCLEDTKKLYVIEFVALNNNGVQKIEPNASLKEDVKKGYMPDNLDKNTEFSSIYIDGEVINVIGGMAEVMEKLNFKSQLLCD
jgi:hypothetical protein